MVGLINIADLKDFDDPQGRTYREVNNAKEHKYKDGDLVEIENGVRMLIGKQTRDCDGTPLYSLTPDLPEDHPNELIMAHGYSESGMKLINAV